MSEVAEIESVVGVNGDENKNNIDSILGEIKKWAEEDKKIEEGLNKYRYGVEAVMNDSFTAYSEHEDFEEVFKRMPKQIMGKVETDFGKEMVLPVMKKMTEYFVRNWGSNIIGVYDEIDKNIKGFVDSKRQGYELSYISLRGENSFFVDFRREKDLDNYKESFKLDNLGWGHPATMRLSERRFDYNIDGLYPLVDPKAKKPYYGGDVRRDRWISLKKEDDRFDGLREELFKKMNFFVSVFDKVLDQYFLGGEKEISDISWKSIYRESKLLLTEESEGKS